MGHIELSRWADLVVVAPATAGLIAKAANGMADDLASTTLLATDKRVLLAPAMNVRMWLHPAVQANVERLKRFDGFHGMAVVGPDEGEMACGEFGPGRMAEPAAILSAIEVPAGGARWPAAGRTPRRGHRRSDLRADDPCAVDQPLSGKQGYAIAEALARWARR
jgi:phosphopantothenoylcysteine decarboxylase/phosphopantothenate--cysteine ligase